MLRNYIKLSLRNLWRHRTFSFNSILSLAVSLAVCLLLVALLYHQWQFDRHHPHADRIYRVVSNPGSSEFASSPAMMGPALQAQYPGVEAVTRLNQTGGHALINGQGFEYTGLYAEPTFFELFDRPIRSGGPARALDEPRQVLLSPAWAARAFGDENPVGKTLELEDRGTFTVAGVLEESPGPSHLSFDVLISFATLEAEQPERLADWQNTMWGYHNYLRLAPSVAPERFDAAFADLRAEHFPDAEPDEYTFSLQPITSIALGPMLDNEVARGTLPRIAGFFLVGLVLVVLLAACFTYTNLSLARAFERMREVGVRKTVGARRWEVAAQFVVESIVLAFVALVGAVGVFTGLVHLFNNLRTVGLTGLEVRADLFGDPGLFALAVGVTFLVGLGAGLYPAFALSKPLPTHVLAGRIAGVGSHPAGRLRLRRTLLGVQLFLSCVFIVTTLLFYRQGSFILEADYGFDTDRLVQVEVQDASAEVLKQEMEALPDVESVAGISALPVSGTRIYRRLRTEAMERSVDVYSLSGDADVLTALGVDLVAGRQPRPSERGVGVINEMAVRKLGFRSAAEAVGATVYENDVAFRIVGVMRDFHFDSLHSQIDPAMLFPATDPSNYLLIRAHPGQQAVVLDRLAALWPELDPVHPLEASTYAQILDELYTGFEDALRLISLTALFALLIAGLGMLGMAVYATRARTKEMGIRKALGASMTHLTALLSREFLMVVAAALAAGLPASWLLNRLWLDFWAYRIEMGVGVFALAIALLLLITLGTVGLQAWRTARADPVEALRYE